MEIDLDQLKNFFVQLRLHIKSPSEWLKSLIKSEFKALFNWDWANASAGAQAKQAPAKPETTSEAKKPNLREDARTQEAAPKPPSAEARNPYHSVIAVAVPEAPAGSSGRPPTARERFAATMKEAAAADAADARVMRETPANPSGKPLTASQRLAVTMREAEAAAQLEPTRPDGGGRPRPRGRDI